MSKIISKAFDATKKIIRGVFLGTPNLFTTSDINRQIEAIKYQLDLLDDKTCVNSDFQITPTLRSSTLKVTYSYSFISHKGCSFSPDIKELSINLTSSASLVYVCLVASKKTVTYEDDFSHEISGVKFEDGTSKPAANHIVYYDEDIILSHSLTDLDGLVGILAIISLSPIDNSVICRNNCVSSREPLGTLGRVLTDYRDYNTNPIMNGDSFDSAISKLGNRCKSIGGVYPIESMSYTDTEAYAYIPEKCKNLISEGDVLEVIFRVSIFAKSASSGAIINVNQKIYVDSLEQSVLSGGLVSVPFKEDSQENYSFGTVNINYIITNGYFIMGTVGNNIRIVGVEKNRSAFILHKKGYL